MPRPDEYSESLRMRLFVCHFCCISCMAAICNFVRRFPHIQIHIDYDDVWKTRLLDIWIWSKKKWLQSYECVLGVAVVAWTWSSFCYLFSCSPPHVERINMPKLLVHSLDILESLSQCISYPKSRLQALKWGTTWLFSNIFDLTAPYLPSPEDIFIQRFLKQKITWNPNLHGVDFWAVLGFSVVAFFVPVWLSVGSVLAPWKPKCQLKPGSLSLWGWNLDLPRNFVCLTWRGFQLGFFAYKVWVL